MKIFISGASGLVGGNCLQYFKTKPHTTVVGSHLSFATPDTVYFNTLNATDAQNFDIIDFNPDVIIHCGALTHVDYCETNEGESYEKTVQSTINLIQIANQVQAKLVFMSTDYVFDGTSGPYLETDATNPLSIYGKHKLTAEQLVQDTCQAHLILRITNVYGDEIRGKNFVARIVNQCLNNEPLHLKLPLDQYATPTNAWDIARALWLLLNDQETGIYHICGTDYMNRVELALKVLSYFPKAQYDLDAIFTHTLNQPAARPLLGGFLKTKFANKYPTFLFSSVDNYLQKKVYNQQ